MPEVIWLVNVNVQPPAIDTHLRHQKFASFLIEDGYQVYIITGSYLHYTHKQLITDNSPFIIRKYGKLTYIFINVPSYNSNGLMRMYSIFKFGVSLFRLRKKIARPCLIVHNSRIPFDFMVYFASKKLNAKYIDEVWDLWPYSFVLFGFLKKNSLLMRLAYKVEKYLYSHSDGLIFTMEGAKDYIKERKWDISQGGNIDLRKCFYINNGIDLSDFCYNRETYKLSDSTLKDNDLFKVIYLGSIGLVNNLKQLIDAALYLRDDKKVVFYIYGNGSERDNLEKICRTRRLDNVIFKEKWIEIKYVPYLLSCGDLNIINYKPGSGKYGGSQGKMFQYLASGKPIVSNCVMDYDIIQKFDAGISENFESAYDYAKAIYRFAHMNATEYNHYCNNALFAAKQFDYKFLYIKFKQVVENVIEDRNKY